jgi:phenylpropionate dioxygenase-like ring-hydroxylating dioxygenase large terminal subunit
MSQESSSRSSSRMQALRRCWHPVAYAHAITDAPHAAMLLGVPLVLWRDAEGRICVLRDACVHRGTALSLGRVEAGEIVCPYHGWRYDTQGRCTRIPQLEEPARVPPKARVDGFRAQDLHGLIWVALDEPRWEVPQIPEFQDPAWKVVRTGPFAWNCDASRQLENFTDFGHFAFVHPGLLGDPARPVVAPYTVEADGPVVRYSYGRPDQANTESFPVFTQGERKDELRRTRYAIHLPFTLVEHIDWGGKDGIVYLFASQPVDEGHCIGYCLVARNYNFDQPDAVMQEFERTIFAQDQRIVESQRPGVVPFDAGAELHLKFDAVAMGYRRATREQGLD